MAFSRSMQPPELAYWLFHTYGAAYRDDIDKLERALINGELFLELPDDEEFLKELNLSLAFKRLVKNKVKELKQGNGAVGNGHTSSQPPSNGQANGANTAQTATTREPNATAQAQAQTTTKVLRSTDRLPPELLSQVLDVMWPARTKATGIGLELGLAPDNVYAIEQNNNYKVEEVFKEMMTVCLRQGLVTQQKLADAVNSRQIGFGYLYDEILAKKFIIAETTRPAAVPVHVPTPGVSMPAATTADFDRFEVKHHYVSRIEWMDMATGERQIVRVYNKAAWRWRKIADNIGLEPGEIQGIQRNSHDDDERVTDVFRRWFDNANNLPNRNRYPKKWSGLVRLLNDSDLGELSEMVQKALSAPSSNVRGNL